MDLVLGLSERGGPRGEKFGHFCAPPFFASSVYAVEIEHSRIHRARVETQDRGRRSASGVIGLILCMLIFRLLARGQGCGAGRWSLLKDRDKMQALQGPDDKTKLLSVMEWKYVHNQER